MCSPATADRTTAPAIGSRSTSPSCARPIAARTAATCPSISMARSLDDATVGAQYLPVDPAAVGAGQEGDHVRDVLRRPEALERRLLGEAVDRLLVLAVEEQVGRGRAGRDDVDGDVAAAQLAGEHERHRLDGALGRGVAAVGGE